MKKMKFSCVRAEHEDICCFVFFFNSIKSCLSLGCSHFLLIHLIVCFPKESM